MKDTRKCSITCLRDSKPIIPEETIDYKARLMALGDEYEVGSYVECAEFLLKLGGILLQNRKNRKGS